VVLDHIEAGAAGRFAPVQQQAQKIEIVSEDEDLFAIADRVFEKTERLIERVRVEARNGIIDDDDPLLLWKLPVIQVHNEIDERERGFLTLA